MATPTTLPASFVSGAVLTAAQMNNLRGAFRVLQTVQTTKTDTFSTTSTSFTDVTGLSVSITPSANTNKVLVIATINVGISGAAAYGWKLLRDTTDIFIGDAAGTRIRATFGTNTGAAAQMLSTSAVFLDSPATTSATTYKVQANVASGSTVYVNRAGTDTDGTYYRTPSSITVMEISA